MVFKKKAYRIGYGKNIKGIFDGEKFVVYYKSRDGVVNSKILNRKPGKVELEKSGEVFNATTVLPFGQGLILSRVDKEIKALKR